MRRQKSFPPQIPSQRHRDGSCSYEKHRKERHLENRKESCRSEAPTYQGAAAGGAAINVDGASDSQLEDNKLTMESAKDLLNLKGKVAIVTGGALGIGYGIAYRLAEAGANVVIADRNEEDGLRAAAELAKSGWNVAAISTDVSDEESVKRLVDGTIKKYGSVDILVNNAGIFPSVPLKTMSLNDFQKVIDVNLNGTFLCTKYVSEKMVQKGNGGRIINITSIDALHPSSVGLAHYDASKHGVWGFTKNIALELAPHKIWVNAIAPGAIMTPGLQKMSQAAAPPEGVDMQKMLEGFLAHIPMSRFGEPDDIGKVALFLASDMSSYMTGSQIVVDGGVLLN